MYGLFVALGSAVAQLADRQPEALVGLPAHGRCRTVRHGDGFMAILCWPSGHRPGIATLPERDASLLVDGYVINDGAGSHEPQAAAGDLLRSVCDRGLAAALDACSAGSFNLVYANGKAGEVLVASDRAGSIPLYHSRIDGGHLVSTNPVALLRTGLIGNELDWAACAEWIHLGFPVGDRHLLRDIRAFPGHSMLRWADGRASITALAGGPTRALPDAKGVPGESMAALMRQACQRLVDVAPPVVHLQSAGMDSRTILAALPESVNPACYTYGRADSTEVPIAEAVARQRGASFSHFLPRGDEVAESLDEIFGASGLMVYPDRYLIARHMAGEGGHSVLDGYGGDSLLGGLHYKCDRSYGWASRLGRLATVYRDQSIARIGLDRIAHGLVGDVTELRDVAGTFGFLSPEFTRRVGAQRDVLVDDVRAECERLLPENDSLGVLYRRFLTQNRSRHAIAQQGVLCRQFLQVLYPITNDHAVLEACLGLPPHETAYRRYHIRLFRQAFPEYADIPYGDSMLPLRRSPWLHNYRKMLAKTLGRKAPLRKLLGRMPVDPNNWASWLRDSAALRTKLADLLIGAGMADREPLERYLASVARGEVNASGKLFHLAAIAQWTRTPAAAVADRAHGTGAVPAEAGQVSGVGN